jgi:hypothetical protein
MDNDAEAKLSLQHWSGASTNIALAGGECLRVAITNIDLRATQRLRAPIQSCSQLRASSSNVSGMGSSAASFRASASGTASGSAAWICSPPAQALAALQTSTTRRHHGVLRCRRREFGDSLLLLPERATKQVTVGGPLAPAAAVRAGSVVQREARGRSAHGRFQGRV